MGDDGTDGSIGGSRPDPRLRGTVLVSTNFRGGLATVELPDGTPQEIELPGTFRVVFGSFLEDGSILAVVETQPGDRVYRLADGPPEPLGPPLRDRFGLTFSVVGDTLLAAGCGERPVGHVLDLNAPTEWRPVQASCGASLSPDAGSMVWSPDGRTLVRSSVGGDGAPEPVLELGEIEGLAETMGSGITIGNEFGWGDPGLAATAFSGDRQAAIVVREDLPPFVAPLGGTGPVARAFLSWQPGGTLLAVMMWNNLEGILRIVDPDGEDARIVAMLQEPPRELVWSPDGEAILAGTDLRWVFVAADGTWLRSIPVARGDSLPLDWRP